MYHTIPESYPANLHQNLPTSDPAVRRWMESDRPIQQGTLGLLACKHSTESTIGNLLSEHTQLFPSLGDTLDL